MSQHPAHSQDHRQCRYDPLNRHRYPQENIMENHSKHPHRSGTQDDSSSPRKPVATPPDSTRE
jgi:hypothetical protein